MTNPRLLELKVCDCKRTQGLLLLTTDDPTWVNLNMNIIFAAKKKFDQLVVADLRKLDTVGVSTIPRFKLTSKQFFDPLAETVKKWDIQTFRPLLTKRGLERQFEADEMEVIEQSIKSSLMSLLGTDRPLKFAPLSLILRKKLLWQAEYSTHFIKELLYQNHYCCVIVPNGRFPTQAGALYVAQKKEIPTLIYERGFAENTYYLSDARPQDFYALVKDAEKYKPSNLLLEEARIWFESRQIRGGKNPFSNRWSRKLQTQKSYSYDTEVSGGLVKTLSIFTSSQDEFWALGKLWPKPLWNDQFEAFQWIIRQTLSLTPKLNRIILRMHPNTLNKSPGYILREALNVKSIRKSFPNIQVVWPQSKINSYSIVKSSDLVCVWDSTIGVEAMFLGKPTLYLAKSLFEPASSYLNEGSIGKFLKKNRDFPLDFRQLALESVAHMLERNTFPMLPFFIQETPNRLKTLLHANSAVAVWLLFASLRNRLIATMFFSIAALLSRDNA